jgi:hypothetical protein
MPKHVSDAKIPFLESQDHFCAMIAKLICIHSQESVIIVACHSVIMKSHVLPVLFSWMDYAFLVNHMIHQSTGKVY